MCYQKSKYLLEKPNAGHDALSFSIIALDMVTGKRRCRVSAEEAPCGYAFDPNSIGTASSIEGTLALGSGGRPAVEHTVVDPSVGEDCHPSAF